jgi:predicted transcriptional regulator
MKSNEPCYNSVMATNPLEIRLSDAQRKQLAETAETTGRSWSELLDDALRAVGVHDEQAGKRLRRILDDLGKNASGVPESELDASIDEATQYARHGKS